MSCGEVCSIAQTFVSLSTIKATEGNSKTKRGWYLWKPLFILAWVEVLETFLIDSKYFLKIANRFLQPCEVVSYIIECSIYLLGVYVLLCNAKGFKQGNSGHCWHSLLGLTCTLKAFCRINRPGLQLCYIA